MASLFDCFAPVFERGLRVDEEAGRGELDTATVRTELRDLVQAARARASSAGHGARDVERAAFAVVAWLDEVMAQHTDVGAGWVPLQVELFNTNNAGNEFFVYLRELGPGQAEVREVYFTALCLGFVGEYILDAGKGGALEQITDTAGADLPVRPIEPEALAERPITPQPYELPLPKGPRLPRHWEKPVLVGATTVAVLVPLGLIGWALWPTPAPPPPPPEDEEEAPPPVDPRPEVAQRVAGYECADLDYRIEAGNVVVLSGFVQSEQDRSRLTGSLREVEGVSAVRAGELGVEPWPFCEVLLVTEPLRERNRTEDLGLDLAVRGGAVLYEGDDFVVEIGTPGFAAYLYLDYVQHDGLVGHVAHAPADEPPDAPDERFPYPTGYEIEEPFGREMIVLIATSRPLFEEPRPEFEPAGDYLPVLRERIDALMAAGADLPRAATHVFVQTRPAEGR